MEGKRFSAGGFLKKGGEEEQVEETILKRRISDHPMYGLLKETHLNCLNACCLADEEVTSVVRNQAEKPTTSENHSDLDQFMEAYCMALVELKQAIQDPMQEAASFIDFMYCLLGDLSSTHTSEIAAGSTDSAEEESVLACNYHGGSMEDAKEKLMNGAETGSEALGMAREAAATAVSAETSD